MPGQAEPGTRRDTEHSIAVNYEGDATDIETVLSMSKVRSFDMDKSCLGTPSRYRRKSWRELSDTFEVTVAFKHPWDWRSVDVSLEGNVVEAGIGLDRMHGCWQNVSDRSHRRRAERPG